MGADLLFQILTPIAVLIAIFISMCERIMNNIRSMTNKRADVSGKILLVTGGGSGIGRGVSIRMASLGCEVVIWDVNAQGNAQTKKMIEDRGGKCHAYTVNLCDRNKIYETAEKVKNEVGEVDILMNNAGIVTGKELLECPDELIQRTFDVNVLSYIFCIKAFLPGMIKKKEGQIVTMGSVSSHYGNRMMADYSASKFAVLGLCESLTEELIFNGHTGISQTFVAPFYINTGMFAGVKSRAIPILEPDYVCDQIVDAIVQKKPELMIPATMEYLIFLKRWLSPAAIKFFSKFLDTDQMMANFVGRKKD